MTKAKKAQWAPTRSESVISAKSHTRSTPMVCSGGQKRPRRIASSHFGGVSHRRPIVSGGSGSSRFAARKRRCWIGGIISASRSEMRTSRKSVGSCGKTRKPPRQPPRQYESETGSLLAAVVAVPLRHGL